MACIEEELQAFLEVRSNDIYYFDDPHYAAWYNYSLNQHVVSYRENPFSIFADVSTSPDKILEEVLLWKLSK